MRLASCLALAVSLVAASSALASDGSTRGTKSAKQSAVCETPLTGSRIRHVQGQCSESMYAFRSISGEKLARTGAFTMQQALKDLDSRF